MLCAHFSSLPYDQVAKEKDLLPAHIFRLLKFGELIGEGHVNANGCDTQTLDTNELSCFPCNTTGFGYSVYWRSRTEMEYNQMGYNQDNGKLQAEGVIMACKSAFCLWKNEPFSWGFWTPGWNSIVQDNVLIHGHWWLVTTARGWRHSPLTYGKALRSSFCNIG